MIDTHAHLDAGPDPPEALIERARRAGVERIVAVGTGIDSCRAALALATRHEGVFSARARKIRVETRPGGLNFTADGEVIGDEPVEFEVLPRTLNVVVGPDYVPEPEA